MKILRLILSLFICISASAEVLDYSFADNDSIPIHKETPFIRTFNKVVEGVDKLFTADPNYVEPSHYRFQAMMMNTNSYEAYRITDVDGSSIRFAPKPSIKIGPYVAWSLIFLGWSVDIRHKNDNNRRKEFDMTAYTLPFGIDFFYRQTGDNYLIKDIELGDIDASPLEGKPFTGFESKVVGLNAYYIFNNDKFSYPAGYNQSTRQKISQGSAIAGFEFTRHSLKIDWKKFNSMAKEILGQDLSNINTTYKQVEKVNYSDFALSGGYAYNWVFAPKWLFSSSLSLALSYKRAVSDTEVEPIYSFIQDFKLSNLSLDGVGRFGINWTNDKWFAGATAVFHTFNYNKPEFYTNNTFGSINIYAGVNLWAKQKYKKKK